jgi:hypothetical protein
MARSSVASGKTMVFLRLLAFAVMLFIKSVGTIGLL